MPLITVASLFFAFVRHGVDCLNLITVYRKEIDSQGLLIDMVTNTALGMVVGYQVCMMAFFTISERREEALVCTVVFVLSVIYIVVNYEKVNDSGMFDAGVS